MSDKQRTEQLKDRRAYRVTLIERMAQTERKLGVVQAQIRELGSKAGA